MCKYARVSAIHKGGEKDELNNYRPISNLTTFNKVFEKLTYIRLSEFVQQNNLISKYQFGFKKGASTTLAIFYFLSNILKTFNTKTYSIALFLDLKKAFDMVDRKILMYKLSHYGFRGITNSFIDSYLSDRQQFYQE